MSNQTKIIDGDDPSTSCPVCLETWNTSDRLPKFLVCHHSICVTCAGELQRTAKKKHPQSSAEPSGGGQQSLSASRESLGSLGTTVDENAQETPSWVRCPMCRTRTVIQNPNLLQTNFYLRGLPRSVSMPRLVLWCNTCSAIAAPECGEHKIEPVGEKMHSLQEELIRRTEALQGHVSESLSAHESHMEVYRWLCGMLRHSHSKVLAALTHAAQYHRALQHHTDAIQNLIKRSENLDLSDEPDESIKRMSSLLKELDGQQSAIINEVDLPILNDNFQILRTHQGPQGYGKALVVLDADRSVTLSIYGEKDRRQVSESESEIGNDSDGNTDTLKRAMSLQMSRRERHKAPPKSVSLQKTALLKAASADLSLARKDAWNPAENSITKQADEVEKENTTSSESGEGLPTTPPYDNTRAEAEVDEEQEVIEEPEGEQQVIEEPAKERQVIEEPEEPVIVLEPFNLQTHTATPEALPVQRDGTFGRQTVNLPDRRYPSHLYEEEPIIEPAILLNNAENHREPEVFPHVEETYIKDRLLKAAPPQQPTAPPAAVNQLDTEPRPSAPPPEGASRRRRHNIEDEVVAVLEDPGAPRPRGRRRKKGRKRPPPSAARRPEEGERHSRPPPSAARRQEEGERRARSAPNAGRRPEEGERRSRPRTRKQSRQRRKASMKRDSSRCKVA